MRYIYDKGTLAGLKLRSALGLRKLTRQELLSRLQIIRTVDPITRSAYRQVEDVRWRSQDDDSPHGRAWHVSFHGSQFPGDNPMACSRQALYRMMDLPSAEPFSRRSRVVMQAGKDAEVELVRTWHEAGILLSASPEEAVQTGFTWSDAWLTSSVDSVIQPPNWQKPLPVEIKTKESKDIEKMQLGLRGPDPAHISQNKVQIALVRHFQDELWPGLQPVTHGIIFYMSRDNPANTAEFRVDYDEKFFEMGVERLKQWRKFFIDGVLPEENPSKRHPFGWRWSYPPCQFCDYKKTCQLDFKEGVALLADSVGIERAKLVRPDYDYQTARQRVLDEWEEDAKISSTADDSLAA
jgi:CRISPR/Cas system-associated exonuclease Cas4 (RecB family)